MRRQPPKLRAYVAKEQKGEWEGVSPPSLYITASLNAKTNGPGPRNLVTTMYINEMSMLCCEPVHGPVQSCALTRDAPTNQQPVQHVGLATAW